MSLRVYHILKFSVFRVIYIWQVLCVCVCVSSGGGGLNASCILQVNMPLLHCLTATNMVGQ
jgi:hypothetical protein